MKTADRFATFPPYIPIEPFEVLSERLSLPPSSILKADANENPFGPSPRVKEALSQLPYIAIYPDPESRALRSALSSFTGVPEEYLFAGSGADELLDLLLRVVLEPGDRVLICPPTFGMYSFDTLLNHGKVITVPRNTDFSLDLPGICKAVEEDQPKVIFLPNPNNPDGRLMSAEEVETLLALPALVVLDEAYIEFTSAAGDLGQAASRIQQVPQRENLVVLRTFSKWAGLAGLRVGYGAFPLWLIGDMWKAKQPYNVNVAASAAAIASLEDLDYLAGNVACLRTERQRLYQRLAALPYLFPYPSQANFILCMVDGMEAEDIQQRLLKQGIIVRYYATSLLKNFLRFSVGTPEMTDRLTTALLELVPDAAFRQRLASAWEEEAKASVIEVQRGRVSKISRQTGETTINLSLDLDGSGQHAIDTGLGFLDHMLNQIAVHGLFDLSIQAQGDLFIDPHHTVEDIGLSLGMAFSQALGDRKGITRCGSAFFPLDEALGSAVVDFSGRSFTSFHMQWVGLETGGIPNSLWRHFCESFANRAGCSLHIEVRNGLDDHHQVEALFKALARALTAATRPDPRRMGTVASSKGTVSV